MTLVAGFRGAVSLRDLDDLLHETYLETGQLDPTSDVPATLALEGHVDLLVWTSPRDRALVWRFTVSVEFRDVVELSLEQRDGLDHLVVAGIFVVSETETRHVVHLQSEMAADLYVTVATNQAVVAVAGRPHAVRCPPGLKARWATIPGH